MIGQRNSIFYTCLLFLIFLLSHPIFSQTFNSWDGKWIKPVGTYRSLNILVNIIYDVNPKLNPDADTSAKWPYTTMEGINNPNSIPNFLLDFQDIKPRKDRESGTLTSLYSESSFGKFILLGEFIIVNIKHSSIKKNGEPFNNIELISSVNNLINSKGGLKTAALYGKTDFADYDKNGNQKFDIVQYLFRNTNITFGGINIGTGSASNSDLPVPIHLGLNTSPTSSDWYSLNGMGAGNFSLSYKSILFHELSHGLFGDNSFHTSGGNHYGNPYTCTFMGTQGGYGLMGASASSLISCNGYERWRLNWQGPTNNLYPIAANNVNSDISIQDGTKTFLLRDFVTYGDAIRIKLPYKDNVSSSEQYIWLENHQVGHNEKLDFFQYAEVECVPLGTAGIYAYYQVGKDIRSSSKASEVWPTDETDNLRPILADGNWDYSPLGTSRKHCMQWGDHPDVAVGLPNPLSGTNDQSPIFFSNKNVIVPKKDAQFELVKIFPNGKVDNSLPSLGDNSDAFEPGSFINVGSNPPSTNTLTYHVEQNGGTINGTTPSKDTRHIYLSGLNISFQAGGKNQQGEIIKVVVRWDDVTVKNDVRWTGSIVLKDSLNLAESKKIVLDQNKTTIQKDRDTMSGEFSPVTSFNAKSGAKIRLLDKSEMVLQNKSVLTLESGSTLEIWGGANLTVQEGTSLIVNSGATIKIIGNGLIDIEQDGNFCVQKGASIQFESEEGTIEIQSKKSLTCVSDFKGIVSGDGDVNFSEE